MVKFNSLCTGNTSALWISSLKRKTIYYFQVVQGHISDV